MNAQAVRKARVGQRTVLNYLSNLAGSIWRAIFRILAFAFGVGMLAVIASVWMSAWQGIHDWSTVALDSLPTSQIRDRGGEVVGFVFGGFMLLAVSVSGLVSSAMALSFAIKGRSPD